MEQIKELFAKAQLWAVENKANLIKGAAVVTGVVVSLIVVGMVANQTDLVEDDSEDLLEEGDELEGEEE